MIGTVIAGRYTLEAEVGRGGMGAVWRGRDEVLGRIVALKRIGVAPGGITPDVIRAEREAKLAAKLNHANVVAVFDLVDEDGQQWLVMEYVEGTNLADLVRGRGRLTPDQAAPILAHTASALAAAHGAGIVHRDVKPSNILVASDGQVKLSDFGIARTAADPSLTQTGLVTGSPAYLSPEVASGDQATPASDVWSWGATLFHALEGNPPYQVGENLLGALYRIVHEEPPRPQAAGWLTPVLEATMTRDPAQRWPISQAQEFLEAGPGATPQVTPVATTVATPVRGVPATRPSALGDDGGTQLLPVSDHAAPPPAAPPPAAPPPAAPPPAAPGRSAYRRRRRRPPWLLAAGAATALVLVVLVAVLIGQRGTDDQAPGSANPSSGSGAPSSEETDGPTAEGMESFIETYLETADSDPSAAFEMLTPAFQEQSNGIDGYVGFWQEVKNVRLEKVSADPDSLEVSYTYRFQRGSGRPETDDVVLQLTFEDGTYLIDGER